MKGSAAARGVCKNSQGVADNCSAAACCKGLIAKATICLQLCERAMYRLQEFLDKHDVCNGVMQSTAHDC